ncbi:hypothetical protein DVH05_013436 [Phytophthora capsici]|nr:hypothetical protein DVH05_013436 [Phytophthora capsici]
MNRPKVRIKKTVGANEHPRGAQIMSEQLQDGEPMMNSGCEAQYKEVSGCGACFGRGTELGDYPLLELRPSE